MVGYCAEYTLGRKLIDGEKNVKIFGDPYEVRAEVIRLDSFSAHADSDELLNYSSSLNPSVIKKVFLVHGELEQQEMYKQGLQNRGFKNVIIPNRGYIESLP